MEGKIYGIMSKLLDLYKHSEEQKIEFFEMMEI